jgi:MFS transporter, CP family, cyanate transporter
MAVFSAAQVPTALLLPALAERHRRWGRWAGLAVTVFAVGTLGTILAPQAAPWLWVALIGSGGGAMFPLGMTIIAWRAGGAAGTAAVSARALGTGYLVAAAGPSLMGLLVDAAGYPVALTVLLLGAAAQALAATRLRTGGVSGRRPGPGRRSGR